MAPSMTFNNAVVVVSKSGTFGLGGKASRRGGVTDKSDKAVNEDSGLRAPPSSESSDHPPTVSPSESTSLCRTCLSGVGFLAVWAGTLDLSFIGDALFVPFGDAFVCFFFLTVNPLGPAARWFAIPLFFAFLLAGFALTGTMTGSGGSSGEIISSS
jgi:hypothetical protein